MFFLLFCAANPHCGEFKTTKKKHQARMLPLPCCVIRANLVEIIRGNTTHLRPQSHSITSTRRKALSTTHTYTHITFTDCLLGHQQGANLVGISCSLYTATLQLFHPRVMSYTHPQRHLIYPPFSPPFSFVSRTFLGFKIALASLTSFTLAAASFPLFLFLSLSLSLFLFRRKLSIMVKRLTVQVAAPAGARGYGCALCGTHLCLESDIMSRHFHGKHGRAFLVDRCENFYCGNQELKELMTGRHLVRDVFCAGCDKNVGWCYDFANDDSERYKIHRFVLEQKLIRAITTSLTEGNLAVATA